MKSNIQTWKENLRRTLRDNNNKLPLCHNSKDYFAIVLKEKNEDGENYFIPLMADADEDEIREFLSTPVCDILRIESWFAGCNCGGVEYITDKNRYEVETINTIR